MTGMAVAWNSGELQYGWRKEVKNMMSNAELSTEIRRSDQWDPVLLEELCRRAGMESEWLAADGAEFESVAGEAARRLGVRIF